MVTYIKTMNTKYIRTIGLFLVSALILFNLSSSVFADNPIPAISSISPVSAMGGGNAFPLTVYGANFIPGSYVRFNGIVRPTTYVSPTQLTAMVPASDIAVTGD